MSTIRLSTRLLLCMRRTSIYLPNGSSIGNRSIASAWPTAAAAVRCAPASTRRTFGTASSSRLDSSKPDPTSSTSKTRAQLDAEERKLLHEYEKIATHTLEELAIRFDDIGEELGRDDYDVEYANGVLTVSMGEKGTYVINKQPPNKQIWISSPVSGPERFDYDYAKKEWFCRHTKETLGTLLNREISAAFGGEFAMPIS
ncbi:Mitochondrial matrix iron chaperone [Coemansia sp. RSA 2049]|nr:Mitochondrial matrix iron chaperone [Coemansia sp. RSA 2049]